MSGFANAIVGGASALIRFAIQSPNFVTGVSGWQIAKSGAAEFNNATLRGTLIAGGGNVSLGSTGLNIHSSVTGRQFDINANAGFLARLFPDDGQSLAQLVDVPSTGGEMLLNTIPSVTGTLFNSGRVFVDKIDAGGDSRPLITMIAPFVTGKAVASITLTAGDTVTNSSIIDLVASQVNLAGTLRNTGHTEVTLLADAVPRLKLDNTGIITFSDGTAAADVNFKRVSPTFVGTDQNFSIGGQLNVTNAIVFPAYGVDSGRGWVNGGGIGTASAAIAATETTIFTIGSFTYRAGRAYNVELTGMSTCSAVPNKPLFRLRKTNPAGLQLGAASIQASLTTQINSAWGCTFFVSGSDVTASLAVTLQGGAAFNAVALSPYACNIYDIGASGGISGYAVQLV